jgi:hypothetical protein
VAPTIDENLDSIWNLVDSAFGGGISKSAASPQGQLVASMAKAKSDSESMILNVINNFDPLTASGVYQDYLGKIYFLNRKAATHTYVEVELGGLPGVIVPSGVLATDENANTYTSDSSYTIGAGGVSVATFRNIKTGPIPCSANTLINIQSSISGWDSINNPAAGILGANEESRSDFEFNRENSVAANSNGQVSSVRGTIYKLDGVIDCFGYDNKTNSPIVYGATSYSIPGHCAVYSVLGGDDNKIAEAILSKNGAGCSTVGNTSITVYDKTYTPPYPQYDINFIRPDPVQIKFEVTVLNSSQVPSNMLQYIKDLITQQFYGQYEYPRERIGGQIIASKYLRILITNIPNVAFTGIKVGISSANQDYINIGIDQHPELTQSNISLVIV